MMKKIKWAVYVVLNEMEAETDLETSENHAVLAAANCNYAAYPWSDSPLETIETITEVVRQ